MTSINIILVLVSGLGVLHGLFLAVLLWTYKKGNGVSNKILSVLLLVLSFRVGKSVFLEFADSLDVKIILIGLAMLMAIGPLFYFFVSSFINDRFQFRGRHVLHFVPAGIGMGFGIWAGKDIPHIYPTLFFIMLFVVYYGHYLLYLGMGYRRIARAKEQGLTKRRYDFLGLLFYALLLIWLVYVLNLFDEFVPYVVGPILYTLVAYVVSFIVIRKGYLNPSIQTKYKTTSLPEEQIGDIFDKVRKVVADEKGYKNPKLTLRLLSEELKLSPQVLSMVINRESKSNFNSFINRYRIKEAIKMFETEQYDHYTIASIAFEVGFNSITSFNYAFKKQTGKTPLVFRKETIK